MAGTFDHLHTVILCGGSDIRLWPLSRSGAPRQLMKVEGESETLLASAAKRCLPLSTNPICVVTDEGLDQEVEAHLVGQNIVPSDMLDMLVEPTPHGTTFAIALAAAHLKRIDPGAIMLVIPGSHHVLADERWPLALDRAYRLAVADKIALVGTTPTDRGVNHALIAPGRAIPGIQGAHHVMRYFPKPTTSQANRYAEKGLWDTGMFMVRASLIVSTLKHLGAPREQSLSSNANAAGCARTAETAGFLALLGKEHWRNSDAVEVVNALPDTPFETAVIESVSKSDSPDLLAVVSTSIEWSSVSTLGALDELGQADRTGNRTLGRAIPVDTSNTTVYSGSGRLVTTFGLRDVMIVDTPDALLVAEKHMLPQVASVINELDRQAAPELSQSREHPEPWGTVTVLHHEGAFTVERIEVLPGHHIPPQRDEDRESEYTVVSGTGTVRLDTHTKSVSTGDSVGVSAGVRVIITNTGDEPFVIMAVVRSLSVPNVPATSGLIPATGHRTTLPHETAAVTKAAGRAPKPPKEEEPDIFDLLFPE